MTNSPYRPSRERSSVHYSQFRNDKAIEQASKPASRVEDIINITNRTLKSLKMKPIKDPYVEKPLENKSLYDDLKMKYGLSQIEDLVWMKFTKDGYLGVVAVSTDIKFQMPPSKSKYHAKINSRWVYNTSGIIIHSLGKEWDKDYVLAFPLLNIPKGMHRGDIERAIGDELIKNDIAILDYYSHRY